MSRRPRAFLIDASIYIFRAWFSMPDRWHNADGWPLNAVYGYGVFLLDMLQSPEDGDFCYAAFDESLGTCFRNDIYPQYKSSRELPDETLAFQLDACRELTECLGVRCYAGEKYEADDYLASLVRFMRERGAAVTLVTRDKDLGQLLSDDADRWWDFAGNNVLDVQAFTERFGVRPDQFADYLALVGDPVDDIPGVPGVGAKSAARLLQHFGHLAAIESGLETVGSLPLRGAARLQERLVEHWSGVTLARRLTALEEQVPGIDCAEPFTLQSSCLEAAADFLEELGIAGPLPRRYRALAERRCAA